MTLVLSGCQRRCLHEDVAFLLATFEPVNTFYPCFPAVEALKWWYSNKFSGNRETAEKTLFRALDHRKGWSVTLTPCWAPGSQQRRGITSQGCCRAAESFPKAGAFEGEQELPWLLQSCLFRRKGGEELDFFFNRATSPVVFLNCYKTSFTLSILSLDSLPWSKSRDKTTWKIACVHIFNITGLMGKVIFLTAGVYWVHVFFFNNPSARHPCRGCVSLPDPLLGLFLHIIHSQGCWLLSSCLFTALLIFIFILLSLKRSL